jgi:hypothetical protein
LQDEIAKFHELEQQRERYKRAWNNDKNLNELHLEVLNLMLLESVQIIANMESETRFNKADIRLKLKDA